MSIRHDTARNVMIAVALCVLLAACSEASVEPPPTVDPYAGLAIDTCDCPVPVLDAGIDHRIPHTYHMGQRLSADGRRIAVVSYGRPEVRVVEVASRREAITPLTEFLPDNARPISCEAVFWSPYDNDLLLVQCMTAVDTNADGRHDVIGANAYILNNRDTSAVGVSPQFHGPHVSRGGFVVREWLAGSTRERDSISMNLDAGPGIYIPQQALYVQSSRDLFRQSPDGSQTCEWVWNGSASAWDLVVDGDRIPIDVEITGIGHASWSPDGDRLALSLARKPADEWRYEMVLIVDIAAYRRDGGATAPTHLIDFQKRFCSYSFLGIHAEFISDRTLAVSMHRDGEPVSFVWEITTDGRRVRQLTSVP